MLTLAGYEQATGQMRLPTFPAVGLRQMRRRDLGLRGEQTAAHEFIGAGYVIKKPTAQNGDLLIVDPDGGACVRIEVKTARKDSTGRYQFCLRRELPSRVCTDCDHADVVLLLAVDDSAMIAAFLVPTAAFETRQRIVTMTDPNRCKYGGYRLHSFGDIFSKLYN